MKRKFAIRFNNRQELRRNLVWLYARGCNWNAGSKDYEPLINEGYLDCEERIITWSTFNSPDYPLITIYEGEEFE